MAIETIMRIPSDHPAFAGHFPGFPVVPGVVLLDQALQAIRSAASAGGGTCRIASAKFLHPVRPGDTLVLRHDAPAGAAVRFDILVGTLRVATGSVEFDRGTPA